MEMNNASFPVFLRCRDDKVVYELVSVDHIQRDLEAIDVENNECEGWDSQGIPISLSLQGESSIAVKSQGGPATRQEVLIAFRDFAASEGVSFEQQPQSHDLHETYQNVKKAIDEARNRRPWWRKVLGLAQRPPDK